MNFIGVEFGYSQKTPAPNGSTVSRPGTDGQRDFYSILEHIDHDSPQEHQGLQTDQAVENRKNDGSLRESVRDRKDSPSHDREGEASKQANQKADKDAALTAVETRPVKRPAGKDTKPALLRRDKVLEHVKRKDLRQKSDNNPGKDLDLSSFLQGGAFEEAKELKPGSGGKTAFLGLKDLGLREKDVRTVLLDRAKAHESGLGMVMAQEGGEAGEIRKGGFSALNARKSQSLKMTSLRERLTKGKGREKDALEEALSQRRQNHEPRVSIVDLRETKLRELLGQAPVDGGQSEETGELLELGGEAPDIKQGFHMQDTSELRMRHDAPLASGEANRFRQFMKEQGNADIVRDAKLTIKDESTGEIRLILKPERLGEVRIRLSLEDNRIAGRIIVENNTVREYFQANMADLLQEFEASGFGNTSLDVFVRQDQSHGGREKAPQYSVQEAAETFEQAVGHFNGQDESLVNLMV
ncbi:MAG: flagellar hook-length control protein FliK [Spirochaetales bacterium]|nr:flagellar hook-length control protein FliK [Spirochaetales bacterium]